MRKARTAPSAARREQIAREREWGRTIRKGLRGIGADEVMRLTPVAEEARNNLVAVSDGLCAVIARDLENLLGEAMDFEDAKQLGRLYIRKHCHKWDPDHESNLTFGGYISQRIKQHLIKELTIANHPLAINRTVTDGLKPLKPGRVETAERLEHKRDIMWARATEGVGFDDPVCEEGESGHRTIGDTLGEDPTEWLDERIDAELRAARGLPRMDWPPHSWAPSEHETVAAQLREVKAARKLEDLTPWLSSRLKPVREAALRRATDLHKAAASVKQDPQQLSLFDQ